MPKSCLSVFPHCERKRQNNPFQIRTFHFHPFFSSLCLRFTFSSLPTFFPKQVYLYGVIWVAMAPLQRKRPRQFVSSYSFERVAVLGRIILLLSPGLHSWQLSEVRLRSGCSGPPGYTMLYTRLPLVSHLSPTHLHFAWCAWCASTAPTQQHWTGRDKKQRPSKEGDQLQQTSTSSTCPKKRARGRQEHQPKIPKSNQRRAGKGKGPGNLSLEKRDQKRDQNEMQTRSEPWQQQTPGKQNRKVESHEGEAYMASRIDAAQAGRTQQQQQAERSNSRQQQAAASSSRQQQAAAGSSRQQQAAAGSSRQNAGRTQQQQAAAGSSRQQQAEPSSSTQNRAQAGRTEHKQAESSRHRFQQEGTEPYRT